MSGALPGDADADAVDDSDKRIGIQVGAQPRNAFQLIDCSASKAQTASGQLGYPYAAVGRSDQRAGDQCRLIADAARAVLIGLGPVDGGKVYRLTAMRHTGGELRGFFVGHPRKADGHQERRKLVVGDRPVRRAADDILDFGVVQRIPVLLFLDERDHIHSVPPPKRKACGSSSPSV